MIADSDSDAKRTVLSVSDFQRDWPRDPDHLCGPSRARKLPGWRHPWPRV